MYAGGSIIKSKWEHHEGRTGGQEELKLKLDYAPMIICKLLSLAVFIFCLAVSSESINLQKWYRLNLQAGG